MRPTSQAKLRSGFTMVEIALCLAIIGFALVAIIGALPAGLNVQRENREDTIIAQDANYMMEAIRSGARGPGELTNHVVSITNFWTTYDTTGVNWSSLDTGVDGYNYVNSYVSSTNSVPNNSLRLTNATYIIGLMSRPKLEPLAPNVVRSNHIVAWMRSISGNAVEKSPQTNAIARDMGLNYRLVVEVHNVPAPNVGSGYNRDLRANLKEIRLKYSWPLYPNGNVGNGRHSFRCQAGGSLETVIANGQPLFFFNPTYYRQAGQ